MSLAADMGCEIGLASLVADGVGLTLGLHVYERVYTVSGGGPLPDVDKGGPGRYRLACIFGRLGTLAYFVHYRY